MRREKPNTMKTILAPIDFSAVSARIIGEAIALARAQQARLVLLHVAYPPVVTDSDAGSRLSVQYAAVALETAGKRLARIRKRLRDEGHHVETIHEAGYPGERIVACAQRLPADYIVLGAHGHGAINELLVGSTTRRVLKAARCPVMVVPAAEAPGVRRARSAGGRGGAARAHVG